MELDDKAWRLMAALQADARAPLKVLALAAGLSIPATVERLRRLQEAGVVRGFHAHIDPKSVGYGVKALVGINVPQPGKMSLLDKLDRSPQVLECHHVAGNDSYQMLVLAADLQDLEKFLSDINRWGETRTSIIFSTPIERRNVVQLGAKSRSKSLPDELVQAPASL